MISVLGAGQLLTICCALAAAAIGDVLATKTSDSGNRIIFTAICGFVVLVTILWFTIVGLEIFWGKDHHEKWVANGSIGLFIFTAITAAFCVGVSDDND